MKWLLMALSMLLMPYTLEAQNNKGALSFGLHIGADYVLLSNIENTFSSGTNPSFNNSEEKYGITPSASAFIQYRFPVSLIAIESSIKYCQTRSELTIDVETYKLKLNHITLNIGAKVYLIGGAYAKATIGAGPCLNSSFAIRYEAKCITNTSKMQVQEHINEAIKGRTLVRTDLSIGYDFNSGFIVDAHYGKGLTDLIDVAVNDFGYSEQRNDSQYIGLNIGYILSKDGFAKR